MAKMNAQTAQVIQEVMAQWLNNKRVKDHSNEAYNRKLEQVTKALLKEEIK